MLNLPSMLDSCGGGNDTVFLAALATEVLALDIQAGSGNQTCKAALFPNVTVVQAIMPS